MFCFFFRSDSESVLLGVSSPPTENRILREGVGDKRSVYVITYENAGLAGGGGGGGNQTSGYRIRLYGKEGYTTVHHTPLDRPAPSSSFLPFFPLFYFGASARDTNLKEGTYFCLSYRVAFVGLVCFCVRVVVALASGMRL